jgi:hypothetical protein
MRKRLCPLVAAALFIPAPAAMADCAAHVALYDASAQSLARDLADYQRCIYRSRGLASCTEEFSRVQSEHLRFEAWGSAFRQCSGGPEGPIEGLKFYWLQTDTEIRVIESRIRGFLPWDTGESRMMLWLSALAFFSIATSVPATLFSWLVVWAARALFPSLDRRA